MTKRFYFGFLCSFILFITITSTREVYDSNNYEDDDKNESGDYTESESSTERYDDSKGRDDQILVDARPAFPIKHFQSSGSHNYLQDLFNYQRPIKYHGLKHKRRKIIGKKVYKYFIPLLLSVLAKVAHFLPVVKLILLALFALVLFSKKALLVSIGSLILVIYDTFYNKNYRGMNMVKDRESIAPTVEPGSSSKDPPDIDEGWWGRQEMSPSKVLSYDGANNKKWNRWWAPQINLRRHNLNFPPNRSSTRKITGNEEYLLLKNLKNLFSND